MNAMTPGGRGGSGVVCSWSGGKDSALALYLARQTGAEPDTLLTMLDETGQRSRSHGLPPSVLHAQARSLGVDLVTPSSSWATYTSAFVDELTRLAELGAGEVIFGDIDIAEHRKWGQEVCAAAGVRARHPLWKLARRLLLEQFLSAGFVATIIVVQEATLDGAFLGRRLDEGLIDEFEALGIDVAGENGEYHSVVTDGPGFRWPIGLRQLDRVAVLDRLALRVELVESGDRSLDDDRRPGG